MEPVYERFGGQLRRVRKSKGLTQADLADKAGGLGRTSIVNIEKGTQRVHLHTLIELAGALAVEPAELIPAAPVREPGILAGAGVLPETELDWVMKVTGSATPTIEPKGKQHRAATKQGRASRNQPARGARIS